MFKVGDFIQIKEEYRIEWNSRWDTTIFLKIEKDGDGLFATYPGTGWYSGFKLPLHEHRLRQFELACSRSVFKFEPVIHTLP